MSFFGVDKLKNLMEMIKFWGGMKKAYLQFVRTEEIKVGKLMGVDSFGNRYFQNDNLFFGRNRWVIYSDRYGYDYDASQVPAEWYGWLHYKTDLLPQEENRPKYKWMSGEVDNPTGTSKQYTPYSTTRRKIEAWNPKESR